MALDTLADVDCDLTWQSQGDDIKSFVETNAANLWQAAIAVRPEITVVVCWAVDLPTGARVVLHGDGTRAEIQLSGGGFGAKIKVAEAIIYFVQELFNIQVGPQKTLTTTRYKQIAGAASLQTLSTSQWLIQKAYDYAMAIEHLEFGAMQHRQALAALCQRKFGQGACWTWDSFNKDINHGISFGDYFAKVPIGHTYAYVEEFFNKICTDIADAEKKKKIEETWTAYRSSLSSLKGEGFKYGLHDAQAQRWRKDNNL